MGLVCRPRDRFHLVSSIAPFLHKRTAERRFRYLSDLDLVEPEMLAGTGADIGSIGRTYPLEPPAMPRCIALGHALDNPHFASDSTRTSMIFLMARYCSCVIFILSGLRDSQPATLTLIIMFTSQSAHSASSKPSRSRPAIRVRVHSSRRSISVANSSPSDEGVDFVAPASGRGVSCLPTGTFAGLVWKFAPHPPAFRLQY